MGNFAENLNLSNRFRPPPRVSFPWWLKMWKVRSKIGKKYTSRPRYWNVPVLVNTGTYLVYQYWPKMWYLRSLERAGGIQKQTILERKNGLVMSNIRVQVSGTWSILFSKKMVFFPNERHFQIWFPTRKQLHFSKESYLNYPTKRHNFACDIYIFSKTRGNKNKQWTHLGALN